MNRQDVEWIVFIVATAVLIGLYFRDNPTPVCTCTYTDAANYSGHVIDMNWVKWPTGTLPDGVSSCTWNATLSSCSGPYACICPSAGISISSVYLGNNIAVFCSTATCSNATTSAPGLVFCLPTASSLTRPLTMQVQSGKLAWVQNLS